MRVLIADDHDLVLSGLALVLSKIDANVTVLECGDYSQAIALAEQNPDLDLVILDLNMPGMNGLSGIEDFRTRVPELVTIVMSGYYRREDIMSALQLGIAGFVPKSLGSAAMLNAFRLVLSGERFLPSELLSDPTIGREAATRPRSTKASDAASPMLTIRETEVLKGIMDGLTSKVVGRALDIQEVTVKLHLRSIYRKLGAKNRAQAVKIALELGL